ncbi:hypothetical protein BFW38_01745 [Terasakiispira papahanaumokuakeensis]|uniref:Flagellar biosynthesis protein FlgN n=1 Tax=Terasakiispira papahanaumokuakeensis TaxID=197479 RepID=A0A1E2V726_9GAMM|nr:flagellar protein FlgN [Terasakiispira papahanaumokuakeensis]ODC02455.1 hypothetical protein BFW38_01745 [Terasakiispira papahanaumokuakeensis]
MNTLVKTKASQTFRDLLLESIHHLRALDSLLQEERQCLTAHEPHEQLEAIVNKKQVALEQVITDTKNRNEFLEAQGVELNEAGVEQFLSQQPPAVAQALNKGWQQLQQLMAQLQESNMLNGRLVNHVQQQVEVFLTAVQQSQGSSVKVYRAGGDRGDLSVPRNLGKA